MGLYIEVSGLRCRVWGLASTYALDTLPAERKAQEGPVRIGSWPVHATAYESSDGPLELRMVFDVAHSIGRAQTNSGASYMLQKGTPPKP